MNNEILLALSMILLYGSVLLWYKFFGKTGLYAYVALATVLANVEVLILVEAFGIEQTLGNVMFASIFLATDILSEKEGKEAANRAVWVGAAALMTYLIVSQIWLLYSPSSNDWASVHFHALFSLAPRITIASVFVYIITQKLDIWLYHIIWNKTGKNEKYLWLRNNGATLISQLVNTVLYNVFAFAGIYSSQTIGSIILAGYIIYIITSICDTPALYLARKIK